MRDLTVYEFEGLTKIEQFTAIGQPIWAPDWDGRLVLPLLKRKKVRRSADLGLKAPGWMSVVVYAPIVDSLEPVSVSHGYLRLYVRRY
jgi:hypothetical protein